MTSKPMQVISVRKTGLIVLFLAFLGSGCLRPNEQTTLLNAPPQVTSISVEGTGEDVTVTFVLQDEDDDSISLFMEYQGGSAGSVFVTPTTRGNLVGLRPGTHSVLWQSALDESGERADDYRIRFTPFDTEQGTPFLSDPFFLDNNQAPSVISLSTSGVFGDIEFSFTLIDIENDRSNITIEYQGGSQEETFTPATFEFKDEDLGEEEIAQGLKPKRYTVIWHSLTDEPEQQGDDFAFQITASDGKASEAILSKTFSLFPGLKIEGSVGRMILDSDGKTVYLTNFSQGRVEEVKLASKKFVQGKSFEVSSLPNGIAQNGDGTRLYVCNRGSSLLSVIEPATETVREISVPQETEAENRPDQIAIAGNVALFSTSFSGTGNLGSIRKMDLATEAITTLSDVNVVTEDTLVEGHGTFILIAPRNNPDGNLFLYDVSEAAVRSTSGSTSGIGNIRSLAINKDDSLIYVANESRSGAEPGITGLNPKLERVFQVSLDTRAIAFAPDDRTLYAATVDLETRISEIATVHQGRIDEDRIQIGADRSIKDHGLLVTPNGQYLIALLQNSSDASKDELILIDLSVRQPEE